MKTAVLTETGFELQERPIPKIGNNDVLIKTHSSGVCSGDVFAYQNRQHLAPKHRLLGHEGSGTVMQVGKDVMGLQKATQ